MRYLIVGLLVLALAGCGLKSVRDQVRKDAQEEVKQREQARNEETKRMQQQLNEDQRKATAAVKETLSHSVTSEFLKQEAEKDAFLAKVKTNPQPLFDKAVAAVKAGIAYTDGDEVAKTATITADKKLKTYGPEKWLITGHAKTTKYDTTWAVTLEMMFGKLVVRKTDLDYRE
jgi:hypothetical protein